MLIKTTYNSLELLKFNSLTQESLFKCTCGTECNLPTAKVIAGAIINCGCLKVNQTGRNIKHGMRHTRFYKIWKNMRYRCRPTSRGNVARYFNRGIKVCKRWDIFINFFDDMYPKYKEHLTLDRTDNNGNYEPNNCRWANMSEQANNRETTRFVNYNGVEYKLTDLVKKYNCDYKKIHERIARGWAVEKAIETP